MSAPAMPRRARTRYALVEEGSVRMAPLLVVPGLLAEMGVDPNQLIAEAGLDAALFDDPDNIILFTDLGRFVALCTERTRLAFGAEHSAVVFAAHWLDRPLPGADRLAHRRIMQEIEAL